MTIREPKAYTPTLKIRVRRTLGFTLGVLALAWLDLRYHFLPRLTGRFRKR
jgi:hypothetical protein